MIVRLISDICFQKLLFSVTRKMNVNLRETFDSVGKPLERINITIRGYFQIIRRSCSKNWEECPCSGHHQKLFCSFNPSSVHKADSWSIIWISGDFVNQSTTFGGWGDVLIYLMIAKYFGSCLWYWSSAKSFLPCQEPRVLCRRTLICSFSSWCTTITESTMSYWQLFCLQSSHQLLPQVVAFAFIHPWRAGRWCASVKRNWFAWLTCCREDWHFRSRGRACFRMHCPKLRDSNTLQA